ncbi:hypothetical protein [Clostridium algidicarnis]|nr:hypothetical protein [Clostridium algidicarnis]MBU3193490.1 hypothetical protein [Clostridium algidicarnis]MBU3203104.1 hypothetical protein [Clostridium algidicarnis]MBU3205598.1 hypothetical protein [Clostridium algidicarnis]MBU3208712.1 hypothetical protein [Clostridium algidicarnis]MBU3211258.1 hypothetical protein [Clostridium algidicarnis]
MKIILLITLLLLGILMTVVSCCVIAGRTDEIIYKEERQINLKEEQ